MVTSPTVPGVVTSPTVPGVVTSPTVPGVVVSPTVPGVVVSPTVPGVVVSPGPSSVGLRTGRPIPPPSVDVPGVVVSPGPTANGPIPPPVGAGFFALDAGFSPNFGISPDSPGFLAVLSSCGPSSAPPLMNEK